MSDENLPESAGSSRRPARFVIAMAAVGIIAALGLYLGLIRGSGASDRAQAEGSSEASPRVRARTPEAAGRYLVMVGACNDCHTPGFMEQGMKIPETQWLTGVGVGWRGPWGTSYPANLRLSVNGLDESQWVHAMQKRDARPPMPWTSLHAMPDEDIRAVYRYIRSLGPAGEKEPAYVPPDKEPKTPYLLMEPVMPGAATRPAR